MSAPIQRIVAGIAALDGTDPVLDAVASLARRTGAILHLLHAFRAPEPAALAASRMGYPDTDLREQYREDQQARLETLAWRRLPGPRVICHATAAPAARALRELARRTAADLLVVGGTRQPTEVQTLLGTTAQRVVRGATTPVLVLKGPLPRRPSRVLLTTDLSPLSARLQHTALRLVAALCDGGAPEIRSLLVVPRPHPGAEQALREFLARQGAPGVHPRVRSGDPARAIAAEAAAWGAELVVLGTRGHHGADRWRLGSVAETALHAASTSTLVIPGRDASIPHSARGRNLANPRSPDHSPGDPEDSHGQLSRDRAERDGAPPGRGPAVREGFRAGAVDQPPRGVPGQLPG